MIYGGLHFQQKLGIGANAFKTFQDIPISQRDFASSCHTSTEGVDEVGVEEPCESVP
jgi:hypothetical protein